MYGAHTIVTSGVFLPKVPLVYHGLAWRLGRTTCTHFKVQVRMNGIIAKKKSFHELNATTKLSRRRRQRRRQFTRPVSLTLQQSLAYLGL